MDRIEPSIRKNIELKLAQIEKEFKVEIIWAIESGSRAWGFESTDSDYDVRFIYKHELKWYLNVLPKREVIELPIEGIDDYSGWDLRKTLFLLNKSNPVLFEWIKSPIVYKADNAAIKLLRDAAEQYFSPISSVYHYLHMAKGNYRQYLQGDFVKVKKYFYVLRPLLACVWIKHYHEAPPMEFEKLLTTVQDPNLLDVTLRLLERKKAGVELGEEKAIPEINQFLVDTIAEFEQYTQDFDGRVKPNAEYLDDILWQILGPK